MAALLRVSALALAGALLVPLPARAVDTIPFTDGPDGAIVVQASIDGRPPIPMAVDLGAGLDLLSPAAGAPLVAVNGKYATLRLTGQRADIPYGSVLSLAAGTVRLEAPAVGIWSGLEGAGVDGLISATAFRSIATTFDYGNHKLVVEDATTFPDRRRTSSKVGLIVRDDLGIAFELFARFDIGAGKTALCQVVTGTKDILFDRALAPELGVNLGGASPHVRTAFGDGVTATIPTLGLIGAAQSTMSRPQVVFADLIHDCYVGNGFWGRRGFTLDIPERALWIPGQ